MRDRPRVSKWVLALARWALLFGLIGVGAVLSAWLRGEGASASGASALLIVGTTFLALAFVLAPFVRNAFGLPSVTRRRSRATYRTTLDDLRDGAETDPESSDEPQPTRLTLMARVVIVLYLMFAVVLIVALTTM